MKVRIAQLAKAKYPGSLTVNPGEQCIFVEAANNALWSRVRMDGGRVGLVSASRLEELKDEHLSDPSDVDDDEVEASPNHSPGLPPNSCLHLASI